MPRKYWDWKNRYYWNSNLDEQTFLCLLRLYCQGVNVSQSVREMKELSEVTGVKPVSRQTISRYFLLFGDYLYHITPQEYRIPETELETAEDVPENTVFPEDYEFLIIVLSNFQALYEQLEWDDKINRVLIGNKTQELHALVKEHSKSRKGLPIETFCSHYMFCVWHFIIQTIRPGEEPEEALYEHLKEKMEEAPLHSFEMETFRIHRN